jgi:hypothetical protein
LNASGSGVPGGEPSGAKLTAMFGRSTSSPMRSAASSSALVFGVEAYGSRSAGYGTAPCMRSTVA